MTSSLPVKCSEKQFKGRSLFRDQSTYEQALRKEAAMKEEKGKGKRTFLQSYFNLTLWKLTVNSYMQISLYFRYYCSSYTPDILEWLAYTVLYSFFVLTCMFNQGLSRLAVKTHQYIFL